MIYTNKYNLPEAYVRAVINDPYNKGESDFSATGLANPPRASALILKHADRLEVDVSSRVAAIIGQGMHTIAERAARPGVDLCEERLFADFKVGRKTWTISAQVDLYETDTRTLMDWKTTKAYSFSKKAGGGKKREWIEQLNIGAELLRRNGHRPKRLVIIALLKDWMKREAGKSGMPEAEVVEVELPLWSAKQAVEHIKDRIRLHASARRALPLCSSDEHWGGRRCGQYCDASAVCTQYQDSLKTGLINNKGEKK